MGRVYPPHHVSPVQSTNITAVYYICYIICRTHRGNSVHPTTHSNFLSLRAVNISVIKIIRNKYMFL